MVSSRPATPANDLRAENGIAIASQSIDGIESETYRQEKMLSEKDYS